MIDYAQVITQIEDVHCGACKHGLAKRALSQLVNLPEIVLPHTPQAEQSKKAIKAHKQPRMVAKGRTEKPCNACHVIKPISAYPLNKTCTDGHAGTCRACTQERAHRYYAAKMAQEKGNALLDKVAADTKKLHDFRCDLCHANFLDQAKLDAHNMLRH